MPFFRAKYEWFWCLLSIISFILSGILLDYYGEKPYWITRFVFVFLVGLWPIAYTTISEKYFKLYNCSLIPLFKWSRNEKQKWYVSNATNAFVLRKTNLYLTIFLWLTGVLTVLSMPTPFDAPIINTIGYIGISVTLYIGVHSVPLIFFCVKSLYDLTKKDVGENFFSNGYELIKNIKNFFFGFSVLITIINFSLFVAIYYSPFGFHEFLVMWICFISMWPIAMYFVTLYSIKSIENNSKKVYVDLVNQHIIAPLLKENVSGSKKNDFVNLKSALEFRDYLLATGHAKRDYSSMATLVSAVLGGLFQVVVAIFSKVS